MRIPYLTQSRLAQFAKIPLKTIKGCRAAQYGEFRRNLKDPTSVRVSISVYSLTNHFNPSSIHANAVDPQFGLFFSQNKRRFRVDFDLVF